MRTVICHFYNEAYLLPWWLKHHTKLFDHGVMIDHGSTDESAEIVRSLAPNWRLVRSRLMHFDAYLTDFEVMNYEQELPGWKIALNVTEFLMPAMPLELLETTLSAQGRTGCVTSGILCVDMQPGVRPDPQQSLPLQKPWGIDDNQVADVAVRLAHSLPAHPTRNRFYHCNPVGMYQPGRHYSYHQDSRLRFVDLMVFHFGHSPWNEDFLRRKLQIGTKLSPEDVRRGWGAHHLSDTSAWQSVYNSMLPLVTDLRAHEQARRALEFCATYAG